MRVGVQGDAVGSQLVHLRHRSGEALGRLPGQPVDEVGIDGDVAQLAGARHQPLHHLERLDAVHRLLHLGVEVLNPEAEAVEAERAEVGQSFGRHGARVDLDRDLGVRRQAERRAQRGHHPRELGVGEEGRRAAAEVELRHRATRAERLDAPGPARSRARRGTRRHVRGAW